MGIFGKKKFQVLKFIFVKNLTFWAKIDFFAKNLIFRKNEKNGIFGQNRILAKNSQNGIFGRQNHIFRKMAILIKNLIFGKKN
jgi:hypothetical protein